MARPSKIEADARLFERIAAGESLRSVAPDYAVDASTLSRFLRGAGAAELAAVRSRAEEPAETPPDAHGSAVEPLPVESEPAVRTDVVPAPPNETLNALKSEPVGSPAWCEAQAERIRRLNRPASGPATVPPEVLGEWDRHREASAKYVLCQVRDERGNTSWYTDDEIRFRTKRGEHLTKTGERR